MSCTSCGNLGSNCSCSDNCPYKTSDITVFDGSFNVLEVPCDASLNDVLALLESYTTNMVNELMDSVTYVLAGGNCLGLEAGSYGFQQLLDAVIAKLCTCPLAASITQTLPSTLTVTASGGLAPYTYQWVTQDNIDDVLFSGSTTSSTAVITGTAGLNKFGLIKCTVTDMNGCIASDVFLWKLPTVG
jgi:hypothetical protein